MATKFSLIGDDLEWVAVLIDVTRKMTTLPSVTPEQLLGLRRALYALERLPAVSPGVKVEYNVAVGGGDAQHSEKEYWSVEISDHAFDVQHILSVSEAKVGGDNQLTLFFQSEPGEFRSQERDPWEWLGGIQG